MPCLPASRAAVERKDTMAPKSKETRKDKLPASGATAASAMIMINRLKNFLPNSTCLRISNVAAWGVPDADTGMGEGSSDPYVRFTVKARDGKRYRARTSTIENGGRNIEWPDVIEIPVPRELARTSDAVLEAVV